MKKLKIKDQSIIHVLIEEICSTLKCDNCQEFIDSTHNVNLENGIYIGEFVKGLKHGAGKMTYNEEIYKGE